MNNKMIIFPAIDIKNGKCVRLFKGDMNKVTIFNDVASNQALEFQECGFKHLHIVDLDGAIEGKSVNTNTVKEILKKINIPTQLGGGIRNIKSIEQWINIGISRIILGTAALNNPDLVKQACKEFPNKIVVGIDSIDGKAASEGWVQSSNIKTIELAKRFEDCGVCAIIYTDISRDGTLNGVDLDGTRKLAEATTIPIIASGGISSIDDLIALQEIKKESFQGVIVGRALYDKKISISDLRQKNLI